ncbi:hypothetical protein TRFO_11863 [Tritrichomonas foetus]|uniref:Uncharacterized protein n=1 Tax=Tritrichomonas foetus TaxID=1144522 RepID=A0A1J4J7L3_9EUKA|nr:hypothetical protein TRFO_11863 [Tritrichomonas foetus]|eukprot:OHS93429.1 hypothetical protein TRFO_11863 [Tritrichomonas foetus]
MDFTPCAQALQEIIVANQPVLPNVNPHAIPSFPLTNKLEDILKMKKENELSHKAKCRKNKKAEKSKGYFEQQEIKMAKQKKNKKEKRNKNKNKGKNSQ